MIARKSMIIVISQFLMRFFGWISLVILANLWGAFSPTALGIIGFAMSFLGLFTLISDLGFNSAHIKRVSEGKDLGTCLGTYTTIKLILVGIMAAVVIIGIFIWKNILHQGFTDATTESVIYVFLLYYVFMNLATIGLCTFEGTREVAKRQIAAIFENVLKVPLSILVALAGVSIAGVVSITPKINWPDILEPLRLFIETHAIGSLSMAYTFGGLAVLVICVWFLRKYPWKRPNWDFFKSYSYFAVPVMLISIISTINLNIDKVMVGYFWTATEVGYYFAAQQLIQMLFVFSFALGIVLFPTLSRYHAQKDFEKIKQTTRLAERYLSMVIMPVIGIIILFVHPVLLIMLNSSFLPAATVMIVLLVNTIIYDLMIPYQSLITGMDKPSITAKIGFSMCLLNIVLAFLFIPQQGLLSPVGINGPAGAATATLISSLFGFIWLRFTVKKMAGIAVLQSHTPRHIIAAVGMGGVLYYLNLFFPLIHWYHLIAYSLAGLGIYLAILYILREFKKKDLLFFLSLLRPKELLSDIRSELKTK